MELFCCLRIQCDVLSSTALLSEAGFQSAQLLGTHLRYSREYSLLQRERGWFPDIACSRQIQNYVELADHSVRSIYSGWNFDVLIHPNPNEVYLVPY